MFVLNYLCFYLFFLQKSFLKVACRWSGNLDKWTLREGDLRVHACVHARPCWVCLPFYFCSTTLLLSTVIGMDVSEASMAGTFSGASTVRTPSGDREEVTFSALAVEGSLRKWGGEEIKWLVSLRQQWTLFPTVCMWICWPLDGSRVLQLRQDRTNAAAQGHVSSVLSKLQSPELFKAWISAVSRS